MSAIVVDETPSIAPMGVPGGAAAGTFETTNAGPYVYVVDDIDVAGDWGYGSGGRITSPVITSPVVTYDDANGKVTICADGFPDEATCAVIERSTDGVSWTAIRGGACAPIPVGGLILPTGGSSYAQTPDDASLDIAGDLDIRIDATLASWANGQYQDLVTKWADGTQQSYMLRINSSNRLEMVTSSNGSNVVIVQQASAAHVPTASGRLAVRVTVDVDNGSAGSTTTFYTAPHIDGAWAQLGTPLIQAGTTTIFNSTTPMEIGSRQNGAEVAVSTIHSAQVRNGIFGAIVANPVFWRDVPTGSTFFTDDVGKTWTLTGSASLKHREVCLDDYEFTPCVTNYYRVTPYPYGLYLPSSSNAVNTATSPDVVALDVTGDIDLRADITLVNWSSFAHILSKWTSSGNQRSYLLQMTGAGILQMAWSPNGTAINIVSATTAITVPSSRRLAVRVTLDVDNGGGSNVVTFYTAPTMAGPWTQLGAAVVSGGTTSIFNSTAILELGSVDVSAPQDLYGVVHSVAILNGINGTAVANPDFTAQPTGTTSFTDAVGRAWTVASSIGQVGTADLAAKIYTPSGVTNGQVVSVLPQLTKIWIKSVTRPFLNIALPALCHDMGSQAIEMLTSSSGGVSRPMRTNINPIINRTYPIAVNDLPLGRAWNVTLRTWNTLALKSVDFLLASGDILFIQVPDGCIGCGETVEHGYVAVTDAGYTRHHRYRQRAVWELSVQEVAPPGPDIVYAAGTWQSVLNQYGTWQAVLAAFPTWQALLAILPQPSEVIVQ